MDITSLEIWLSFMFAKVMLWGVPQFILAALTLIAAWRHKTLGMWLLAVAATLTVITKVWLAALVQHGGAGPGNLRIVSYPGFLALLISIGGWAVLAFTRTKKPNVDA